MYDIIIIGGGISGLYLSRELSKKFKILLIEKSSYLGGRIYTHKVCMKNKSYSYEAGAGRISESHKLLLELIRSLNLTKKLIEIPTVKTHLHNYTKDYEKFYNIEKYERLDINFLLNIIINKSNKFTKKYLSGFLFIDFLEKLLSKDSIQFLLDSYGYKAEFLKLNAYDAIRLFSTYLNIDNKFYVLENGLSQVVDKLVKELSNVDILKQTLVEDFEFCKDIFTVKTRNLFNSVNYKSKIVIFATNKDGLLNIPSLMNNKRLFKLVNSVNSIPMARIYAIFEPKNNKIWFDDLGKITTNGNIQYIIPINKKTGLIMISYPDLKNAIYWKNINLKGDLRKEIMKEIRKMFPYKNIPEPIYIKMHYWNSGVHSFKPDNPSYKIYDKILKPFKNKNLFISGEAYSNNQAWIEGALETSIDIINKINEIRP